MKKSTIIVTVVVVLVVALLASYIWYGSDDGGEGQDNQPDGTDLPVLTEYDESAWYFDAYIGYDHLSFFLPYTLEPTGNVIELRPIQGVSDVADNGDGTYSFAYDMDPGKTLTMSVSMDGVTNLTTELRDGSIMLTFDAAGEVGLYTKMVNDDPEPGGETVEFRGYFITGSGFEVYLNGESVTNMTMPVTIPKTGNVIEIRAESWVTRMADNGDGTYSFWTGTGSHEYRMDFTVSGTGPQDIVFDSATKTVKVSFDCVVDVDIELNTDNF